MSITGILSSGLSSLLQPTSVQSTVQKKRAEFQQLGQDLQSGNLSAAQQDFATLSQNSSTQTSSVNSSTPSNSAVSLKQSFSDLKTALSSGDISGAQQAYSQIQQDFQANGAQGAHGHHHHHGGGAPPVQGQDTSTSSTADLMSMLTGATNSSATSAYSTTDLMALLGSSSALNAAA